MASFFVCAVMSIKNMALNETESTTRSYFFILLFLVWVKFQLGSIMEQIV